MVCAAAFKQRSAGSKRGGPGAREMGLLLHKMAFFVLKMAFWGRVERPLMGMGREEAQCVSRYLAVV